jgi:hypothetical protein
VYAIALGTAPKFAGTRAGGEAADIPQPAAAAAPANAKNRPYRAFTSRLCHGAGQRCKRAACGL